MNWIEAILHDLRYGLRVLRKHPFSNGVIVLTMALLIGAASVLYASLREQRLQLAPFPGLETMAQVWRVGEQGPALMFSPDLFPIVGFQPVRGRFFDAREYAEQSDRILRI